jgi:hypothetical protein
MAGGAQPNPDTELATALDPARRKVFRDVASHLIPAAHGMPAAGDVVDDRRLAFVLRARPDVVDALRAALRPELGGDPGSRLAALAVDETDHVAALQLAVVAGYYTDANVRAAIGYPGQLAKPVTAFDYPAYIAEGLIDQVLERGPIWRDPDRAASPVSSEGG